MRSILGLALAACSSTGTIDVTGYVVDKLCWNRDGHVGVDGTPMGTAPETHRIYCMLLSRWECDKGYIILKSQEPDANGYTYAKAYSLDGEQGTQAVIDVLHKEFARTGTTFERLRDMGAASRRLREQFTVTGEVSGETLNVKKICLTPMVRNDQNEEVCLTTARGGNVTNMASTSDSGVRPLSGPLPQNNWLFVTLGSIAALLLAAAIATAAACVIMRRRRRLAAAAAAWAAAAAAEEE